MVLIGIDKIFEEKQNSLKLLLDLHLKVVSSGEIKNKIIITKNILFDLGPDDKKEKFEHEFKLFEKLFENNERILILDYMSQARELLLPIRKIGKHSHDVNIFKYNNASIYLPSCNNKEEMRRYINCLNNPDKNCYSDEKLLANIFNDIKNKIKSNKNNILVKEEYKKMICGNDTKEILEQFGIFIYK